MSRTEQGDSGAAAANDQPPVFNSEARTQHMRYLASLVEDQVKFADTKASLLVAGNALLLNLCISLITHALDCSTKSAPSSCGNVHATTAFGILAALLLLCSVALALFAVRPNNKLHKHPPAEMFLFSWIADQSADAYIE